jgi:hypothetical protein
MYGAYEVMFNDWLHPPRQARLVTNHPEDPAKTTMPTGKNYEALQCTANCIGEDELLITGGRETTGHSNGSLHYSNEAVDIAYTQPGGRRLSHDRVMQCAATCGYTHGWFEYLGVKKNPEVPVFRLGGGSHWHVQLREGGRPPPLEQQPLLP